MKCQCNAPNDKCPIFGARGVGRRLWEICSGNCPSESPCTEEQREALVESFSYQEHDETIEMRPREKGIQCLHLGEDTGERIKCGPCKGNVRVKVFACAVHSKCTLETKITKELACCEMCKDFKASVLTP